MKRSLITVGGYNICLIVCIIIGYTLHPSWLWFTLILVGYYTRFPIPVQPQRSKKWKPVSHFRDVCVNISNASFTNAYLINLFPNKEGICAIELKEGYLEDTDSFVTAVLSGSINPGWKLIEIKQTDPPVSDFPHAFSFWVDGKIFIPFEVTKKKNLKAHVQRYGVRPCQSNMIFTMPPDKDVQFILRFSTI